MEPKIDFAARNSNIIIKLKTNDRKRKKTFSIVGEKEFKILLNKLNVNSYQALLSDKKCLDILHYF